MFIFVELIRYWRSELEFSFLVSFATLFIRRGRWNYPTYLELPLHNCVRGSGLHWGSIVFTL
jgi:hypothetical protein